MREKRWEPGCTFSGELTGSADKVDVASGMPPEVRTGTLPLISGFVLVCRGGGEGCGKLEGSRHLCTRNKELTLSPSRTVSQAPSPMETSLFPPEPGSGSLEAT